jgi:8-oxo-dGTP diphosphatase
MEKLAELNFENTSPKEAATFAIRNAVRAVIFDKDNKVALMSVSRDKFHKLPGGGIEDGEEPQQALRRECKEEAGVEIEDLKELGLIVEIKKADAMIQNSYCYTAHVVGKKNPAQLTESEKAQGFELLWVDIDEAICLVENDGYLKMVGKYIRERELTILKQANHERKI